MPLAFTTLMQPLLISKAQAVTANAVDLNHPASFIITNTYADANKIPQYAVGDVAAATEKNIVVNYPNTKVLNPTKPATRGEITALIYQTLVSQGKIEPIAINSAASQFIVRTPIRKQKVK